MALGYATGSVAGIGLLFNSEPLKVTIINGAAFTLGAFGSNSIGTGGKVFNQIHNSPAISFGLHFHYAPIEVLQDILAAIRTALNTPDTFAVNVSDDFVTINWLCTWNFDEAPFPTYPEQRTNETYIKDYIMHFYALEEQL